MWFGLLNSAWEMLTYGKSPWTLKNSADYSRLKQLDEFESPERHWVERTLPPRDRFPSFSLPGMRTTSRSRFISKWRYLDLRDSLHQGVRNPCENFCPAEFL